jgi:hypothetical protein
LNPPEGREMTDRMVPDGFIGNYWGPAATRDREEGKLPPVRITPHMARWDKWGRQVLQDGDIVFRLGDARVLHGYFPMSRFYANASNSKFSHTGIVSWEQEGPVVYDTTGTGVARQPFCVWILDNVGNFGVKRLKPEHRGAIPRLERLHQRGCGVLELRGAVFGQRLLHGRGVEPLLNALHVLLDLIRQSRDHLHAHAIGLVGTMLHQQQEPALPAEEQTEQDHESGARQRQQNAPVRHEARKRVLRLGARLCRPDFGLNHRPPPPIHHRRG